jgi:hypothetical protein
MAVAAASPAVVDGPAALAADLAASAAAALLEATRPPTMPSRGATAAGSCGLGSHRQATRCGQPDRNQGSMATARPGLQEHDREQQCV